MSEFQPVNLPVTYDTPQVEQTIGAPAEQIREPSLGLSLANSAYEAIHEGPSATIGSYLDARLGVPDFKTGGGITGAVYDIYQAQQRPKLDQNKVDQLWAGAGIPDKAPDAGKYTDVAIYYLLDRAKGRQTSREIDEATSAGVKYTLGLGTQIVAGMADPINLAAGVFPAAKVAQFVGATRAAAAIGALETIGATSANIAARVGARAATGAIEGLVGNVPLEAVTAPLRSEMGEDYSATDSLLNLAFGSAIGGGIHIVTGGLSRARIARDANPETAPVSKIVNGLTEEERSRIVSPDGGLTPEGEAYVRDRAVANTVDNTELVTRINRSSNPELMDISDRLYQAGLDTLPEPENLGDLSIKSDMSQAIDDLVFSKEQGIDFVPRDTSSPVSTTLGKFINDNTTTPRMISELVNNYHNKVNSLSLTDRLTTNKNDILNDVISRVQPTAEELATIASPQTREAVLKTSVGQMMDDKYPTVDALIKSDQNIGKATMSDVERELSQQNNPENSYMTDAVPERAPIDKEIPFENDIDYVVEKAKIDKQISDIEKLSELGLYSVRQDNDNLSVKSIVNKEELQQEVTRQFGKDGAKLLEAGKITVVDKVSDLPGNHGDKKVQGLTREDGTIYLVAENIDPVKLKGIVLHEVGIHGNLRNFVGDKTFNNILKQMDNILAENDDVARIVEASLPSDTPETHIAEEKLAYMIENLPDVPLVKEFIAKIRAYLYKTFPSLQKFMKLTDQDLGQMAALSLRNYANERTSIRSGGDVFYSQASDIADETRIELDELNKVIGQTQQYRADLQTNADMIFRNIDDRSSFIKDITSLLPYVNKDEAKELYADLSRAYQRYFELGNPNPEQAAVTYAMDKLEYGQAAHKLALTHDRAVKNRLNKYLATWAGFETNGLDSLLIGTTLQNVPGARAYNLGAEMVNVKRQVLGNMLKDLKAANLEDAFTKGIFADDTMRAMEALQNGGDTSRLAPEAVQLAKIVQDAYDNMQTQMRENGLMVNKVKNYFFNQANLHSQEKIFAAGFENWKAIMQKTADFQEMAEAMNISVSDIDDELLRGMYEGLAEGEHVGNNKTITGQSSVGFMNAAPGSSFRGVKQKQRVIHFKNADAVIEYRNHFGNRDFASSVIGTIESNAKQLAILKTLGVNYERNLNEVARDLQANAATSESRKAIREYIQDSMQRKLQSVDGRADRLGGNETWARLFSNIRAIKSMSSLGFATISAVTDVVNSAAFLNRKGLGRGLVVDSISNLIDNFTPYSDERKQFLSSMGVFSDSIFGNAYRDGNADQSVGKSLSKAQGIFFKLTGLDAWTTSSKQGAEDSLMHYMGLSAKKDFDSLHPSLQKQLGLFNINKDEWNLIRNSKLKQIDGREYLTQQEFDSLRPQIENKFSTMGLAGEELNLATNKYLNNLKRNMFNFYMDGLSHMVIEPDAATKYYQTWGGLKPSTAGGQMARFTMQFKSFSIGFMRKVLFDQIYENNNSLLGYLTDFSKQGIGQKIHMAKYIAGLTVAGYVAGVMKDFLKGKKPRPLFDEDGSLNKSTLTAAFLQGGSLGIYGDFMFGDFNRFGGDLLSTAAGPVLGSVNQIAGIYSAARSGQDFGAKTAKFAISNTPFVNSFYTSAAFNYLFAYSLQEYLNPGSLRRMERNIKQQNNQEFFFPPSQYAPRW